MSLINFRCGLKSGNPATLRVSQSRRVRDEKIPTWGQRNIAFIVKALSYLLSKQLIESLTS